MLIVYVFDLVELRVNFWASSLCSYAIVVGAAARVLRLFLCRIFSFVLPVITVAKFTLLCEPRSQSYKFRANIFFPQLVAHCNPKTISIIFVISYCHK